MKFDYMAQNLQIAITEIMKDDELVKLLSNNSKKPLEDSFILNKDILNINIFAEPYSLDVPVAEKVELRLFYPNGMFDSSNSLAVSDLYFQIIYHKNLDRILIDNKPTLRSFEIMQRIIHIFEKKSFYTLSNVLFKAYEYSQIDKDYGMYTLISEVMTV